MKEWIVDQSEPFPKPGNDDDAHTTMLCVMPNGEALVFEATGDGHPLKASAPCALGAGRELALGAMLAGASAEDAVRIATERHAYCRGPVYAAEP